MSEHGVTRYESVVFALLIRVATIHVKTCLLQLLARMYLADHFRLAID